MSGLVSAAALGSSAALCRRCLPVCGSPTPAVGCVALTHLARDRKSVTIEVGPDAPVRALVVCPARRTRLKATRTVCLRSGRPPNPWSARLDDRAAADRATSDRGWPASRLTGHPYLTQSKVAAHDDRNRHLSDVAAAVRAARAAAACSRWPRWPGCPTSRRCCRTSSGWSRGWPQVTCPNGSSSTTICTPCTRSRPATPPRSRWAC